MGAGAFGEDPGANVRQADQAQEEQLIGGPGEYYRAPRAHGRHRNNRPPEPRGPQPESDAQLQAIEAELNQMQGVTMDRNHSQLEYDASVPQQPGRPMGGAAGANPFGAVGMGETMGTEQAMLNKVIEDSLKQ